MHLLVIRTSAMGDVALTTPVLKGMREQFPEVEITMVTKAAFKPFFSSIDGINLIFPEFSKRHKGFIGIIRLYRDIKKNSEITAVVDLHDVLRSKVLRLLFRISGTRVVVIDKGRSEKRSVITGRKKIMLKHTVERYAETFAKAGFSVVPIKHKSIIPHADALAKADSLINSDLPVEFNIGVAPFAKHKLKVWPVVNMIELLNLIAGEYRVRFWIFGGKEDLMDIQAIQNKVKESINISGKYGLGEELAIMSRLDLMISMDSSNMHMAALSGIKVISIWGGTDPLTGFGAWRQPDSYSIRIPVDELECRPCTIYGKGECSRGDFACMIRLTPDTVFKRLKQLKLL